MHTGHSTRLSVGFLITILAAASTARSQTDITGLAGLKARSIGLCLLFIHPRAPNLINLRSAGTMPAPCRHDFVVGSRSHLYLQGSSRAGSRECRSSAAARRPPPFGETAAALEGRPRGLGAIAQNLD